jgi:hypothetical protein
MNPSIEDMALATCEPVTYADAATTGNSRYDGRHIDVAQLLAEPDTPIPWRCGEFAADGYLTILAGPGGDGKSWTALAFALGVSTGTTRAGIRCRRGRALIMDAENGRDLLRRRLRAAGVRDGIGVVNVDGLDIVADAEWFRSTIAASKANLVVVDSLRMLSPGRDENDSKAMEPPISTLKRIARETHAAIVLVHHAGKSGASGYRGSSVIKDQTDIMFSLKRVDGDPEARTRRKLVTEKCRIAPEPEPRWLAIISDLDAGTVSVDEADAHEGSGSGERPRDRLRDEVLDALRGIAQPQAVIAKKLGRDKKDQTVRRVLADLAADGLAHKRADGWAAGPEGVSGVIPLAVDTLTPPSDGLDDLGPELPQDTFADALRAPACRCDKPLPAPDEGEIRCSRCGLTCAGWGGAA